MGQLTTITIYNDALGEFEKHPKEFAEAIFKGINEANLKGVETSIPFGAYANYISIQPSRHADNFTIYIHGGNSIFNLNPYEKEFKKLVEWNPKLAKEYIDSAMKMLKNCREELSDR